MIDLDRLLELQKKCDTTFEYKDVDAFLDTTSIRSDYFRQLVINAPALLEALTLARKATETLRAVKGLDGIKSCLAHGNDAPLSLLVDDVTKLAALLGKEATNA